MPFRHFSKKILAILLSLAVCLSFCVPVASADGYVTMFDSGIDFHCESFYMINLDTGTPVIDLNSRAERSPASVTKLTTALLTAEAIKRGDISLKTEITANYDDFNDMVSDGSTAGISQGETVTVEQLIYCMLVGSANEAANILARCVSGSISDFVTLMNSRTKELGCVNSRYINPHGLTDKTTGQYNVSCAYDVSLILSEVIQYDYVCKAMSTTTYLLNTNKHTDHKVTSGNYLLDQTRSPIQDGYNYEYEFLKGGKTGYTSVAGACLASYAEKDGMTYLCVAMGGERESKYTTNYALKSTKEAYIWAFDSLSVRPIVDPTKKVAEVPVNLSFDAEYVSLVPKEEITALIPNDYDVANFYTQFDPPASLTAPITKGQVICSMDVTFNGDIVGTVDLVADKDIEKSATLGVMSRFEALLSAWWFWAIVGVVAALLLLYIVLLIHTNIRRNRSRRRNSSKYRRGSNRSSKGRRFR